MQGCFSGHVGDNRAIPPPSLPIHFAGLSTRHEISLLPCFFHELTVPHNTGHVSFTSARSMSQVCPLMVTRGVVFVILNARDSGGENKL